MLNIQDSLELKKEGDLPNLDTLVAIHKLTLIYNKQGCIMVGEVLLVQVIESRRRRVLGLEYPEILKAIDHTVLINSDQGCMKEVVRSHCFFRATVQTSDLKV